MKQTQVSKSTVFTTLDGQVIKFIPFSWDEHLLSEEGLRNEYRENGEIVDCPQYVVKFEGGTQQLFDHDAKSILKAPPDTAPEDIERVIEEQKATWAKYQDASARLAAENQAELVNLVYTESLANVQLPEDKSWEERQLKKHIKIPTDPEEKRLHYINTVLLKYRSDQIEFISTVVAVSMGATREAEIDIVKKSFLDSIWSNAEKQLPGRNTPGKVEIPQVGQLDSQPQTEPDSDTSVVAINENAV
jgi:hypothetical protein